MNLEFFQISIAYNGSWQCRRQCVLSPYACIFMALIYCHYEWKSTYIFFIFMAPFERRTASVLEQIADLTKFLKLIDSNRHVNSIIPNCFEVNTVNFTQLQTSFSSILFIKQTPSRH